MNNKLRKKSKYRKLGFILLTTFALQLTVQSALAHLMVAQHGTLNIIENDAFLVLSLPVSGFANLDDNKDGLVSMIEFNHHRTSITQHVNQHVKMHDQQGNIELQSIILSPVVDHHDASQSLSQITVVGKFALRNTAEKHTFEASIFGKEPAEQSLEITAKRKALGAKHTFELTPKAPSAQLFK
ncbi:hypothetical protein [Aliiglaciecola lipolytica]|uniref:EF-hand domain-containing protein n=1 Tax=Aliiglaciecola lipolytica E3 TaxID=1127673 RepID=K6YRE9_9ALTE|nr:hypothetical protein [Aliiglaciecola lipolytica]GAC13875.1 hypothetical protein GLIP_1234 [Aliiglaciecola lipolytica E3]